MKQGYKQGKKTNQRKRLVFLKILTDGLKGVIPITRLVNVENRGDW